LEFGRLGPMKLLNSPLQRYAVAGLTLMTLMTLMTLA